MTAIRIIRTEKLGKGPRGEVKEVAAGELKTCDCCGRSIKLLAHMANGDILGEDCALLVSRPDIRRLASNQRRPNKPVAAYLLRNGIAY